MLSTKSKGQTLIEVLIVLSVATIMVVALISAVLSGLKSSQFANYQAKATKYAQDAMDKIKTARDRNINVSLFSGTSSITEGFQSFLSDNNHCSSSDTAGSICYFSLNNSTLVLTQIATTDIDYKKDLGDGLKLNISAGTGNSNEKIFTVQVFWNDGTGEHSSNLQTILRNYQ